MFAHVCPLFVFCDNFVVETYNRNKSVDLTDDSLYYLNMISNVGGKPDAKTVNTVSQTDCKIGMLYVRYDIISFCFSG